MATLTELRAFHLVAEAGGFSQAARERSVSQSTLSAQVRGLERVSGVRMFERKARGITLTAEGERLYAITQRMFAAEQEARHLLSGGVALQGGHLRLIADGAPIPVRILSSLSRTNPALSFNLTVSNSQTVNEALLDYRADIGISAHLPADPRLRAQPFAQAALTAMVPATHPLARRPFLTLAEMIRHKMVIREKGSQTRAVLEDNLVAQKLEFDSVQEVGRQDAVREMVAAGFGIGVAVTLETTPDQRLAFLPIADAAIRLTEYVICLDERRRNPMVGAFIRAAMAIDWSAAGA